MELNFREPQEGVFGSLVRFVMNKKNRWGSEAAAAALDIQQGETFLEVGFGSGWALRKVLQKEPARIIGYELSESMFKEVSAAADLQDTRISLYLSDCRTMDAVEDDSVDKMLTVNVVYFLDPLEAYAREFYRVLRPGGKLICLLKLQVVSRFDPGVFVNTEEGRIEQAFADAGFQTEMKEMQAEDDTKDTYTALVCSKA